MKTGIIYILTNIKNGKQYVGKTTRTFAQRWQGYIKNISIGKPRRYIHRAMKKHGMESFKKDILYFPISELNEKEKEYIKIFNTKMPHGYNMTDGGEGTTGYIGYWYGKKKSEIHKRKISLGLMGKKQSDATKEKHRIASTGRRHSKEMKQRFSVYKKKQILNRIIPKPVPPPRQSRHTYRFEHINGVEYITDKITKFCEKYDIHESSAYRIITLGKCHKGWCGYRVKKDKAA